LSRNALQLPARGDGLAQAVSAAPSSPSADAMPLALRGVSKRWHKDQTPVLEDVDLDVDIGTSTWIGGRNGVGKTTLLRIAAGLIDPDRGPAGDRGLYARLTVRRQLTFWARIAMVDRRAVAGVVEEAIDAFALRELAGRRVDRMSMGQRQRVRIAMTFLAEPEVVLLDEPLTSLDSEGAAILGRAIDALLDRGGALLWCSPEGERLDRRFDAKLILEQGRLVPA
jgi:ABC-type multidrug transport system ATPase subunit